MTAEEMLRFWFPSDRGRTCPHGRWFRGGGDPDIVRRFAPLLAQAVRGERDAWVDTPRS